MTDHKQTLPTAENSTEGKCVHEVFAARAHNTPDALAVTCEGRSLSYSELNTRSNQLAHYLQMLGIGPEVTVGIYLERSLDTIVGLLGILKAGGAYIPLDPTYPRERIAFMLEDSRVEVFLTQEKLVSRLPQHRAQMVRLDLDWQKIARCSGADPDAGVTGANLAYVIYTSGSTGTPKGVAVNHASVVHLFESLNPAFGFGGSDVWTVSHSYAFDFSVWEIFGALLSGGRLVVVPLRVTQSPREFYDLLRAEQVTVLSLTPSALRQLAESRNEATAFAEELSLRVLIGGGDVFPSDLVPELLPWNIPLWNFYGPTESTVWSTLRKVEATDVQYNSVPVGKPIADIDPYLLDEQLQPVAAGVAGELYLGGAGLARGYFKRPELTAERFVPNPFSDVPGARVYKTGDLGRLLSTGDIEHLGRLDHQVKVRGFRIELEEIEAVLAQHPSVAQCIVLVREDQPGEKRLVAYLVPRQGQTANISELLVAAKAKLPEYMVPAAFVLLEELPLTPNKKIDRLSLPAPDQTRPALSQEYLAPRNTTEKMLAEIWSAVLCLDRVGIHDSFFELGGHSLLATKVISRVRDTFQVDLPLSEIFEYPTVDQLAGVIDSAERSATSLSALSIPPAGRDGHLPLSFPQERVWFIHQLFPQTLAYNFQSSLRFKGALDSKILEQSLNEIVRRHEIFRTTFPAIDGRPMQVIHEPWPVKLELVDLTPLPEGERSEALERHIREELQKHFDLTKLPLIRWILLRVDRQDHVLLHVEHHLVHDGWSFNVFLAELLDLYRAFAAGKPSPLPGLPVQFADFAVWQRQWMQGDVARAQLDYWRETLAGSPEVLEVQTDHPRPAVQSLRGTSRRMELPLDLCESLRKFSREHGVTLFMTLLAAFEVLLHRLSGQDDFRVGSAVANRRWPETENMIGMLVNTIALRADFSGEPDFLEVLSRVRKSTLEAYTHQDLPFDMLVDALRRDRDLSRNPLFQVMFNFHDAPLPEFDLPGVTTDLVEVISNQSAKFDFNLILVPRSEQRVGWSSRAEPAGITEIWEYSTDLFDEETILRFEGFYRNLLAGLVANPKQSVAELPLLAEAERQRLLTQWQSRKIERHRAGCIHELFEGQAARVPENVALVFEDKQLTYRELNARSNQLAHYLRSQGVGPETLVAICLERSLEMVIALLAVLKAGGAYVPLDPDYPRERLSLMLSDMQAPVLLTASALRDRFPDKPHWDAQVICVDAMRERIAQESLENPRSNSTADNLAYVIYTSGSTGKPKGVQITHENVMRLFEQTEPWFGFDERDVWTLFHSYAFDFSVWELWGALNYGGRLVIVPYCVSRSPDEFYDLLRRQQVTVLNQTPSAFRQLIQAEEARNSSADLQLRLVIFGGEALDIQSLRPWFERHGDQRPQLVNMYGITETTVHVTYRPLAIADLNGAASSVIGGPISDLEAYVLDRRRQIVPVGVPGELYVGGGGVARGYLNRPELTAETFVPNSFSDQPGGRLYRTGDLVRYRANGDLEYLRRVDTQVKVRGFRIELGEIEAALSQHSAVRENVVITREDLPDDKRLVAYVVLERQPESGDDHASDGDPKHLPSSSSLTLPSDDLRRFLKEKLPEYMVPAAFVELESIPLTSNGKVDRRALPEPDRSRLGSQETFVAPRTTVEQKLAEIWATLLRLNQVGVHDNFFELGGHSLLATQAVSRIRDTFEVELAVGTLFSSPTVAELADAVSKVQTRGSSLPAPAIVPVSRDQPQGESPSTK